MKKVNCLKKANVIRKVHILIFIITVLSMFLIFYRPLLFYSATWLISIWTIEKIYGNCPLTVEEYKLRRNAGQKIKRTKFIPGFLKEYFGIQIPDGLANFWINLYFLISILLIIQGIYY